jgi:hypothetical protein
LCQAPTCLHKKYKSQAQHKMVTSSILLKYISHDPRHNLQIYGGLSSSCTIGRGPELYGWEGTKTVLLGGTRAVLLGGTRAVPLGGDQNSTEMSQSQAMDHVTGSLLCLIRLIVLLKGHNLTC